MSARTLDAIKPYPDVENPSWPLLEQLKHGGDR